jgi:hypothetical protein
MKDAPIPNDDKPFVDEPRRSDKPVGVKLVLASIFLLAYVGYLIYVGFSDPR